MCGVCPPVGATFDSHWPRLLPARRPWIKGKQFSSVRPRERGDPGPNMRTSPSLGPRFRGDERKLWSRTRPCLKSKENRPLFAALGQGSPSSFLPSPSQSRGMARRQGALPGLLRAGVRIAPDDGRETSRPAPCGAPTRHLGLYAFDRGRTGPAHSGRRGCPSTARGRGCVSPSLAGAAPVPRLQNASGRRPSKSGSG